MTHITLDVGFRAKNNGLLSSSANPHVSTLKVLTTTDEVAELDASCNQLGLAMLLSHKENRGRGGYGNLVSSMNTGGKDKDGIGRKLYLGVTKSDENTYVVQLKLRKSGDNGWVHSNVLTKNIENNEESKTLFDSVGKIDAFFRKSVVSGYLKKFYPNEKINTWNDFELLLAFSPDTSVLIRETNYKTPNEEIKVEGQMEKTIRFDQFGNYGSHFDDLQNELNKPVTKKDAPKTEEITSTTAAVEETPISTEESTDTQPAETDEVEKEKEKEKVVEGEASTATTESSDKNEEVEKKKEFKIFPNWPTFFKVVLFPVWILLSLGRAIYSLFRKNDEKILLEPDDTIENAVAETSSDVKPTEETPDTEADSSES